MAIKKGRWVSVSEAGVILGLSDKTILRRIHSGTITYKKIGRNYSIHIPDEDIPEVKQTPKPEDKKPKEETIKTQQTDKILNELINQLKEKDAQIRRIDDRLRENNILLMEFRRLLPPPREEQEREGEATKPTKKREVVVKNIVVGIMIVATLGLTAYMVIQSQILTLIR